MNTIYYAQRGGALLVAMVMIFMLSIMGVSVMRSSTLEKRMAINAIQTSTTFQAAESASDLVLNDATNLTAAFNAGQLKTIMLDIDEVRTDIGLESLSTLTYIGDGAAEGFSFGEDTGSFMSLRYVANGISKIEAARSQRNIEQGAYRVVPAR
jgi:hypothetical protein